MKRAFLYGLVMGGIFLFAAAWLGMARDICALLLILVGCVFGCVSSFPTDDKRTVFDVIRKYERMRL